MQKKKVSEQLIKAWSSAIIYVHNFTHKKKKRLLRELWCSPGDTCIWQNGALAHITTEWRRGEGINGRPEHRYNSEPQLLCRRSAVMGNKMRPVLPRSSLRVEIRWRNRGTYIFDWSSVCRWAKMRDSLWAICSVDTLNLLRPLWLTAVIVS